MSEPIYIDFTLVKGASETARFHVTDGTGLPVSLVGAKVWFMITTDLDNPDANAFLFLNSVDNSSNFDLTNGINGFFDLTLTNVQTAGLDPLVHYVWTYKIKLSNGKYGFPTQGKINVVRGGIAAT